MEGKYDSKTFGIYLLSEAIKKGITNMNITKLMKLMYICYGFYYVVMDRQRLIISNPIAMPYGPVFYNAWRDLRNVDFRNFNCPCSPIDNDADTKKCVDAVLDSYGKWTASELVRWTHRTGTPWWDIATINSEDPDDQNNPNWGTKLSDNKIWMHFEAILSKAKQNAEKKSKTQ